MRTGYIYSIVSKSESTVYIGSTIQKQAKTRRNQHYSDLKLNIHGNYKLQRLYNKYGKEDLIFTVELKIGFKVYKELIKKEKEWISFIPEDYCLNINREPEENPMYNREHTEESKELNRIAHLGKEPPNKGVPMTLELLEKNRISHLGQIPWNLGVSPKESTKEKLRLANLGKTYSEKTKELHRINMSAENNPNTKFSWEIIKNIRLTYWCDNIRIQEIANYYNVNFSTIHRIIMGKTWKDQEYLNFLNE